jgi:hypothetical protein
MANGKVRRRHLVELQIDAECEAVRGLTPDARTAAAYEAIFEYAVYVAIASRVRITLSELTTLFSDVFRRRLDRVLTQLVDKSRICRTATKRGVVYSLPGDD